MTNHRFLSLLWFLLPATAGAGTLEQVLTVDAGKLTLVPDGPRTRILLPGYPSSAAPGEIALPSRTVRLVLPPSADLRTLKVEATDEASPFEIPVAGLEFGRGREAKVLCPELCPGAPSVVAVHSIPLSAVGQTVTALPGGQLGPMVIAEIIHRPVELDQGRGVLVVHPRQRVRVAFDELEGQGQGLVQPNRFTCRLASRLADNPEILARFYPRPYDGPIKPGVAIVTTEALANQSQVLPDYVVELKRRGFDVYLVTEVEYDNLQGQAPNERPQKVRAWLQQNFESLHLEAALLIGNPDPFHGDLPMLAAHPFPPDDPSYQYAQETPTDAYFADLTGNWDLDGDGKYAEWGDDGGPGGVDFFPEIQVGRIPNYGDVTVLDKLLQRSIDYSNDRVRSGWRRRILFPGAILFLANQDYPGEDQMEGGDVAEYMKTEAQQAGFKVTTMYEHEGIRITSFLDNLPLTEDNLIREWNKGYGLVYWFGHGDEEGAYRLTWTGDSNNNNRPDYDEQSWKHFMDSLVFDQLPARTPAFVFQGSCSNGVPEVAANLGYTLMKSGAIGTYSSSRVGIGAIWRGWTPDPSDGGLFTFGYYVMSKLQNAETAGASIGETRALISGSSSGNVGWHTKFGINLYGDPTLNLVDCQSDQDCDDGAPCTGQETCQGGICRDGTPVDCSGLDAACVAGRCDPGTGQCLAQTLDGNTCDDGKFCTVGDRCQQDHCLGSARVCTPEAECTVGICDEENRTCRSERAPEGQSCPLGKITGECHNGICQEKPKPNCGCQGTGGPELAGLLLILALAARRPAINPRAP